MNKQIKKSDENKIWAEIYSEVSKAELRYPQFPKMLILKKIVYQIN